jgi:hypothetical protein
MTDVTTHLVDLVHWMAGNGKLVDFDRDVMALSARQWATVVPRALFSRITGLEDFPAYLSERVTDGALHYLCNAALSYRFRGIPVEIETLWGLEEPENGGDLHSAILRGTKCDLIVDKGHETQFQTRLTIHPVTSCDEVAQALADGLDRMQEEFPGLGFERARSAIDIMIPSALRTTHEQHFSAVLNTFLGYLDEGKWPATLGAELDAKYTLLAQALELSRQSSRA